MKISLKIKNKRFSYKNNDIIYIQKQNGIQAKIMEIKSY